MPKSFLLKRHSHNGSKDVDTRVLVKKAKSTSREDIKPTTEFLFSTPLPYYDQEPAVFQFRSYPFPAFGPYHHEIIARDYLSQSAMHEMQYSYPISNYEKSPFRLHKPFESPVESFQTFPLLSKNEIARHPFQTKVLERKPEIELDFSRKREEIFTAFNLETEYKQDPGLKCEQCGKSFKTKYTLAIHMRMPSHTGARPFVCGVCGKGFRLSSTLCRHRIIHTSERPHKCHLCDKAFNRSSTLKTHIRTHSESKEYICETCGKGFHQKGNLRNHILIHTGEKPYRCRLCEKAFNKLSNLKFHMHVHTDNSPYRCRFCKVTFTRRCDLKSHIANVHEEDVRKE